MQDANARAVVITGASTGIGASCAAQLDRLGFRVFAGVRRVQDGDRLTESGSPRLTPLRLDVTDPESLRHARELVAHQVGEAGLGGLINNAGIAVAGPLEAVPIQDLRRQLEVNVIGQVAATQAFLPLLRMGRGRIINMGSIAGRGTMPLMGPYSASKYALEAITDALRLELRPWGIQVSIIEPGAIATPIWDKSSREAAALESIVSTDMQALYAPAVAAVKQAVANAVKRAVSPDVVVRAVVHALTAPTARTRYVVGRDAKFRAMMIRLLPDRVADRVITWALKLPDYGTQ